MTREVQISRGHVAIVDDADYPLVRDLSWHAFPAGRHVYAYNGKGKGRRAMHRLILGAVRGEVVDHINGNTLDNRRANLRRCTTAQNCRNRARNQNNSSGFKGVYWSAQRKKWAAQVKVNYEIRNLGFYDTAVAAACAYDKGAAELFGEFSRPNFQKHRDWLFPHEHVGTWPPAPAD